jgi:hypothetical protein
VGTIGRQAAPHRVAEVRAAQVFSVYSMGAIARASDVDLKQFDENIVAGRRAAYVAPFKTESPIMIARSA